MKKLLIIGAGCFSLLTPLAHAGRGHIDVQIGIGGVGVAVPGVVVTTPVQPYYYNQFPTQSRGIPPAQYYYYEQRQDPCATATYIDGQYNPPAAQAYCRGAYERGVYGR